MNSKAPQCRLLVIISVLEHCSTLCQNICITIALPSRHLHSGAGVFQERIFFHRTLHFTSQLFSEYKELQACEAFPTRLPTLFTRENESLQKTNRKHWLVLISMYTAYKLAFQKDKLIAMTGIAKTIQKRYGDEYVAGLWRRDLGSLLRWSVVRGTIAPKPPYRAPSWSVRTISFLFSRHVPTFNHAQFRAQVHLVSWLPQSILATSSIPRSILNGSFEISNVPAIEGSCNQFCTQSRLHPDVP